MTPTPADLDYQDGNSSSRDHAPSAGSALETAHTPGPWEYVASNEHHGPYVTTAADCTYGDIADCYAMSNPLARSTRNGGLSYPIHHQSENADANARLIAAAPELLEALKPLAYGWTYGVEDAHREALKAARLAIAKAEGRA